MRILKAQISYTIYEGDNKKMESIGVTRLSTAKTTVFCLLFCVVSPPLSFGTSPPKSPQKNATTESPKLLSDSLSRALTQIGRAHV